MNYYEAVKLLQANGWSSVKMYKDKETWCKNNNTFIIVIKDYISKQLINSIIASV